MILLLILPFWVNEILRAFSFRILFGTSGVINAGLQFLGLVDQPIDFIRADVALYAGLSYAYILLMAFPLSNAIESRSEERRGGKEGVGTVKSRGGPDPK